MTTLYIVISLGILVVGLCWWLRIENPSAWDWESELVDPGRDKTIVSSVNVRDENGGEFRYLIYSCPDFDAQLFFLRSSFNDKEDLGMFDDKDMAIGAAEEHAEANRYVEVKKDD